MTDHDELCPEAEPPLRFDMDECVCDLIAATRADEREQIAHEGSPDV